MNMYVYRVNDSMFHEDIALVFNCTRNEMEGYIRKRFGLHNQRPKKEGEFSKISGSDGSTAYLIFLERFNFLIEEYGLLAHEVMHCVYRILSDLGMYLDDSSVEAYCYYYQNIYQDCIAGIRDKLNKKKK